MTTRFNTLAHRVPGKVGVAIACAGSETVSFGEWADGVAWSTICWTCALFAAPDWTDSVPRPTLAAAFSAADSK